MRHVKQYEGWRLGSYVSTFMLKTCATTYEASLTASKMKTAFCRNEVSGLLALWKDADPDIPILKQAKAEYAKLQ